MLDGIFTGREVIFIAEIGMNHNGNPELALRMIEGAKRAGADAVKFQTFIPECMNSVYTSSLIKHGIEGEGDLDQINFLKRHALSRDAYRDLFEVANEIGIVFFSSPFDVDSVEFLESLGSPLYKVASSEVTNHLLLREIARTEKPVIMSTGISEEEEISLAVDLLFTHGTREIVLMHCVSLYPVPWEKMNLSRIQALRERFNLEVGFSDHSSDYRAVEAAAILGARIFEKHFIIQRDMDCPDRNVSIDPEQFRGMRNSVEMIMKMLGDGHISYDDSEKEVAKSARRSLFARRDIPAGKVLEMDDVIPKRPGLGIPVYLLDKILGRKSKVNISKDFLLREEFFE
jgi:N,N'-diacetyllegionaminate synthase